LVNNQIQDSLALHPEPCSHPAVHESRDFVDGELSNFTLDIPVLVVARLDFLNGESLAIRAQFEPSLVMVRAVNLIVIFSAGDVPLHQVLHRLEVDGRYLGKSVLVVLLLVAPLERLLFAFPAPKQSLTLVFKLIV